MSIIRKLINLIRHKRLQDYYSRSPRFKTYVDKYCKSRKKTVDEALSHALVREVARSYKKAEAEEAGRIPAGNSTYAPMGECV